MIRIADVGLRLSTKVCTLGEDFVNVESAVSVFVNVSLTPSMLKKLAQILGPG